MIDFVKVGMKITKYRKEQNLTQDDLADDHVLAALFGLIQGAGIIVVGLGHQRNTDMLVFRISAGGNGDTVGSPGPGCSVLITVADVLGIVAPAVAVVADSGHHGKGGLAIEHHFQTHVVGGRIGLAHPVPCTVFDGGKDIRCTLTGDNTAIGLAISAKLISAALQNDLCHKNFLHVCFFKFRFVAQMM